MVALAGLDPIALGPLPAAIRAHLLLDSMERGLLSGREALEMAGQAAGQVEDEPWAIETTFGITNRSSDVGTRVSALARGLDRDSLRHRWILQLLRVSPVEAREALLIPVELPAEPKCADGFTFHRKWRWLAAAAVYQRAFTAREIADGKRLAYFEPLVLTASVYDYHGLAEFLKGLPNGDERHALTRLFFSKVSDRVIGPRTFHVLASNGFAQELAALGMDPAAFLRKNLSSQVCRETVVSCDPDEVKPAVAELAVFGIVDEDWAHAKDLGAARVLNYWSTARSRALLSGAQRLRYSAEGNSERDAKGFNLLQPEEVRQLERWRIERDDLVSSLESWTESVGNAATAQDVRQICVLLKGIVEAEPAAGRDRAKLEKRYLDFLVQRGAPTLPHAEWLSRMEEFVATSPQYPLEQHRDPWVQAYGEYRRAIAKP